MIFLHLERNPADRDRVALEIRRRWVDCEIVGIETRDEFETILSRRKFDMILAGDGIDGFAGVEALAVAQKLSPESPMIFVSSSRHEGAALECIGRGATDFVFKDRLQLLLPTIERVIKPPVERETRFEGGIERRFEPPSVIERPRQAANVIERGPKHASVNNLGKKEWILLVDDEPSVRYAVRLVLELDKYQVLEARDGIEGLTIYREKKDQISLVISDFSMPEMDGLALKEELERINANVRLIFYSGVAIDGPALKETPVLGKPCSAKTLLAAIQASLNRVDLPLVPLTDCPPGLGQVSA